MQLSKSLLFILAIILNIFMLSDGKELEEKFNWNSSTSAVINLLLTFIVLFSILNILWINYTYLPVYRVQYSKDGKVDISRLIHQYLYVGASFYWHLIFSLMAWLRGPYYLTLQLLPSLNLFKSTKFIMK